MYFEFTNFCIHPFIGNCKLSCYFSITFGKYAAYSFVSIKLAAVVFSAIWADLVSDIWNINRRLVLKYESNSS